MTYAFQYKKGKVVKVTNTRIDIPLEYAYDKKGNLSEVVTFKGYISATIKFKNAYFKSGKFKGKLSKRVTTTQTESGYKTVPTTTTYKWKAIKVPKEMAAKVNAQQWALLNSNLNFANGGDCWGFAKGGLELIAVSN